MGQPPSSTPPASPTLPPTSMLGLVTDTLRKITPAPLGSFSSSSASSSSASSGSSGSLNAQAAEPEPAVEKVKPLGGLVGSIKRGIGVKPAPGSEKEEENKKKEKIAAYLAANVVDEGAMIAASAKCISPKDLILKAKMILATNNGADDPALLAADFKFNAPIIGPLGKEEFLTAFTSFKLGDGFPDANGNFHSFRVDPFEPNRVWFDSRFVGANTGTLSLGGGALKATGKRVESPPQATSMTFNEQGECTQLTAGYVMDKNIGNTGGLGGVFGIFYAIGYPLPFPEGQPAQRSTRYRFFQALNGLRGFVTPWVSKLSKLSPF